jgi:hypothetical protein
MVTLGRKQARYTKGVETRRQPAAKRLIFKELLEAERQHARLVEAFSVGQTPAVLAAVRSFPNRYTNEYADTEIAMSIHRIEAVSVSSYYCNQQAEPSRP